MGPWEWPHTPLPIVHLQEWSPSSKHILTHPASGSVHLPGHLACFVVKKTEAQREPDTAMAWGGDRV